MDSLDSSISVGTGTPVDDGLSMNEAKFLLRTFIKLKNLMGLEITEINPTLDEKKPMQNVIANLISEVFSSPK